VPKASLIRFTARRYATSVYAVVVCLCHKPALYQNAKRRTTQTTPYDSPGTGFLTPKISAKFKRGHPVR